MLLIQPRRPDCFSRISLLPDSGCSADGDLVHAQRGLSDTDRHALAVLAGGADARIEGEIVAYHCDTMEVGRPVADQHCALDRRADLTVLDPVGLGALEHIFSRSNVDLAAAKADRVKPVLHRGDDLLRV